MRLSEEELISALRDEREGVDPGFAAALDEWAAAGFPRAERPGADRRPAGLLQKLRLVPPRRLLAPAGAALTLIVIAGVAISQSGNYGSSVESGRVGTVATQEEQGGDLATPAQQDVPLSGGAAADAASEAPPAVQKELRNAGSNTQFGFSKDTDPLVQPTARASTESSATGRARKVAQDVDLALASEPEKVREVADGVNEVVNRYRGFVVTSSVQSGDAKQGLGASFELRLPARNLQAALADLSELAHVQSRTEGTIDITERFASAEDRIEENARARRSLLQQLEDATTEAEIAAIRAQLRNVNAQLAAARTDLAQARQRIQLVPVNVSIVAEEGADSNGDWSIGDALDDAGQVLSTAAGIVVVAGAVLLPVALIGAIFAIAWRATVSRRRERALDE